MKSKTILLILALALAAGVFNSCKKDHVPATEPAYEAENDKINQLLGNFTDNYETFKSGKWLKSGDKIDYDSVLWYIDSAINFNYASGHYSFAKIHKDTIFVEVPVDPNMKALLTNVFDSYGESLLRIGEKYYANTGEYKKFIMATVSDAGPLPDGKRKLRVATLTGTGLPAQSEEFGNDENYKFNNNSMYNCNGELVYIGAPEVFEAKLFAHFEPSTPGGCRYYFFGNESTLTLNYKVHRLNTNLTNYLDYKVFAASNAVLNHPITGETECLEYNQGGSGIHEMQFYFDHLITFTNEWLNQAGNSGLNKKWFCGSIIESHDEQNNLGIREIWHTPKLIFKKRGYTCVQPPVLPY